MKDGPEGEEIASRLQIVEIGQDEDGEVITTCIVEPCETSATKLRSRSHVRLAAGHQRALDILTNALAEAGECAPPNNHIPAGATVVPEELYRRYYLAATSGNDKSEDTRRKSLSRAIDALVAKNIIGTWNKMVWKV
jgi:hypothetical protein